MDYTKLGSTGLEVSRLCLGCMSFGNPDLGDREWALREDEARPIVKKALDAGINFFDTANIYSYGTSEEITGKLLWEMVPRHEIVLATKVNGKMRYGPNGGGQSRKAIMHEIDQSLKRLGTDYVDLYQIHRYDKSTPMEETLEALHDVVKAGKARYIGASSMFAWQFMKMLKIQEIHGWVKFVSMQNQVNLLYREEEREMLPLCRTEGIGVIPWSPLARGRLARQWQAETKRSNTDPGSTNFYKFAEKASRKIVRRVEKLADKRGVTMAQIAVAWHMHKPYITAPIVGATKPEHIDDAVAALDVVLTDSEIARLEEPYTPVQPVAFS